MAAKNWMTSVPREPGFVNWVTMNDAAKERKNESKSNRTKPLKKTPKRINKPSGFR